LYGIIKKGEIRYEGNVQYVALTIIAAHLHLIIRDHHIENDDDEAMRLRRHCHPMDLPLSQKNVRM